LMSYSVDIRERVIIYVQAGGSQVEASRLFGVIYNWSYGIHTDATEH